MTTFEDFLEKEKGEWMHCFKKSRELMEIGESVELTFDKKKSFISIQVPMGRLSMGLYDVAINISPDVCETKTSSNFKIVAMSHELGEYCLSCSPVTILYSLILRPWTKYRERRVNRSVYSKLITKYGEAEAKTMIQGFIKELLGFSNRNNVSDDNIRDYIEKCMPFLIEKAK